MEMTEQCIREIVREELLTFKEEVAAHLKAHKEVNMRAILQAFPDDMDKQIGSFVYDISRTLADLLTTEDREYGLPVRDHGQMPAK